MNALEIIAQDLFDKVRSRFTNLQMGDETGGVTLDPKEARMFDFDFILEGNNLGRVSISINNIGSLKVFYSQGIVEGIDHVSAGQWYDFLKEMRAFAKRRLLRFDARDISKDFLDQNDFQFLAQNGSSQENAMQESNYYGSSMSSYRKLENTKLILRHSKAVDENVVGGRSRHVKAIFIENEAGERFKYPFIHLAGAKAMQRHVSNGGNPFDTAGQAITTMSEHIIKLGSFKRHVGSAQNLTTEAVGILDHASAKLTQLRNTMEAISKQKNYEAWMESVEATPLSQIEELDETTLADFKSKFTISSFKDDLAQYFPLLNSIMRETSEIDLEDYVGEGRGGYDPEQPDGGGAGAGDITNEDSCTCDLEDGEDECPVHGDKGVEENTDHLKNPNTPAVDRKKAGYKLSADDVKNDSNKNKYDFHKRAHGKKHPEDTREAFSAFEEWAEELDPFAPSKLVQETSDQTPEERQQAMKYIIDLNKAVKSGQVQPTPELQHEFEQQLGVYGLGMRDEEIDRAWQRITGEKTTPSIDPKLRKPAPPMDKYSDNSDDEEDPDINKYKGMARSGSIGTNDFGAELGEEDNETAPQGKPPIKEIAEVVKSMFDPIAGAFPRGETGVKTHISVKYGDTAGELAEKLCSYLIQKHEGQKQFEHVMRNAGIKLAEAEKISAKDSFNPLKHVKNPTKGEKTAAKDVKRGSYADRAAMLKSAEADGRLKK
jgi:hypothetical protein